MIRFLATTLTILVALLSHAATYYVSPNGNDANLGTSISAPWRTITKVNSRSYVAGDQILFERGGSYRGSVVINQSGVSGTPITIAAYGAGARPILLGSSLASNWVIHSGNIWKTQLTATQVVYVFYNDSLLTLARYPNSGWLKNDYGSASQINDTQLNQPSGYWNNASVVVRSSAWSYDTATVLSYTTGTLNLRPIYYNLSTYEWGYFLQNKLEELDVPGEWYFDKVTATLYLYPLSGNPNSNTIDIVTANGNTSGVGIRVPWQRSYVTIENLDFRRYGYAGVSTSGSTGVMVRNCGFDQCDHAIWSYGNNQVFSGNTITRCYKLAINSLSGGSAPSYGNNNLYENNTVDYCAIYPGLGKTNWGYFGISVTGQNNIIRGNRLSNIGYIGLTFEGNTLVEKNIIRNACAILNDGSGIAFDRTDGAIVRNNIVLSTIGNVESCAANYTGCDPKGKGIYFGNISNKNVLIEGNTVAYCNGAGIWFDHTMASSGNQIKNNTLFGNNLYQLGVSDFSNYNGPAAVSPYIVANYPNQSVTGNIFYSNQQQQKTMYHINKWYSGVDFADFNSNRYINPWDTVSIEVWNIPAGNVTQNYSLSSWRAVRGDDALASNQPYLPATSPNDHILVYNDSLTTRTISLPTGTWSDLSGTQYQSSITLDSFKSSTLYRVLTPPPPAPTFPVTPSTNASLFVQASASANSITISWTSNATATGYTVQRKIKTATTWGTAIATLTGLATQYVDNTAAANTYYEYKVTRSASVGTAYGYVSSAIQLAPVEYRGKIVLVVDNTFTTPLATQLTELETDLKKDGWNVVRVDVARTATPSSIRTQIQTIYNADPTNVKSVLLFGHVPVYRSGNIAPDGHTPIPWACDAYYGEMNGTWSTAQTVLPSDLELEIGRIDLFGLPAFGVSEQQLLSNYLTKLHQYKLAQHVAQTRMLMQDNFTYISNPLAENGYRNCGPLVGVSNLTNIPSYNNPNFISRMVDGWLWGYFSGGGSYNSADGIGTITNFASTQNNAIFNMSFGSYFGNWDCSSTAVPNWNNNTNNLLRGVIANGKALTNVWAGQPNWFFHHMGLGDPIGYSTKVSINNRTSTTTYSPQNDGWESQGYTTVHLGLMGDPSLRMTYIAPPSNLTISQSGSNLTFNWVASTQAVDGYYLYQITNGVPSRVHPSLITGTTLTGTFTTTPGTEYMIRAVKLVSNTSGSYNDLSLGTTAVVPQPSNPTLAVKVFLQGPFSGTTMNDNLRSANLVPLADPYPSIGYTHVGSSGATTTSAVLAVTGNNAIVDWIVIEIRNATTPTQRLYTVAGLLQKDGDVVATDGVSPLTIPLTAGNYHVAVRHRNHLGIMTSTPISLSVGTTLNFTTAATWGTNGMTTVNGINVMWAGDVTFDGVLKYTGTGNDKDPILTRIGGAIPTNIITGYFQEDVNLSGVVKYTGLDNDRDIILSNIGGTVPTSTKQQQIP